MLEVGEDVVVETPRGPVLGTVRSHVQRRYMSPENILRVLRKANAEDARQAVTHERREQEAYRFAIDRIRTRDLPMKLIRAQFMHDGSKIVFFFSAEGRVDFRDLVKDLAHKFRTRIEMHQIGVRDGARMLGGVGPCGRELCCSTFLENFAPVSIRMAKDQGLTLNPKKVSGMCGRLMCCLVYEQQLYKSMRRRMPRSGTAVFTEAGPGVILSVDVINSRATVELQDMNRRTFLLSELATSEPKPREIVDDFIELPQNPDFLWDDVLRDFDEELVREAQLSEPSQADNTNERRDRQANSSENPERRRRARRRRPKTESGDASEQAASPNNDQGNAERPQNQEQRDNNQRRRRRSRHKPQGEGAPPAGEATPQAENNSSNKPKRQRRTRRPKPQGKDGEGKAQGNKPSNQGSGNKQGGDAKSSDSRKRRRPRRRKKDDGGSGGSSDKKSD